MTIPAVNFKKGDWVTNYNTPLESPVLTVYNSSRDIIVLLHHDGTVEWNRSVRINEASKSFANALSFGGAQCDGLYDHVRDQIIDSVFDHLSKQTKTYGPLSNCDLTNERDCYKLLTKLSGYTQGE